MRARVGALAILAGLLVAATTADEHAPELEGDDSELEGLADEEEPEPEGAGGEAELDDAGWWWSLQTGLVELPPPPSVPEDGLLVGNGIDGPTAVAGVRFLLDDEAATGATLTLEVANEQGGEAAGIKACPAIARWRGADAGRWDQQPTSDCDAGEVAGTRAEDGEAWTFDLAPLVDAGMVNVILQPGALEAPDGAPAGDDPTAARAAQEEDEPSAPFQVAFEAPEDGSLEAGGGFGDVDDFEAPEPSAPQEPGEPDAVPGGPPDEAQGAAVLDMGGDAPADPPATGADAPEVAESEAPRQDEAVALVPPDEDGQETGDEPPMAMQEVGFGGDRVRQVAALVALACGVAALLLWRAPATGGLAGLRPSLIVRPEQAARHLRAGAVDDGTTGGLGRFKRARNGDPPPL